MAIGQDQRRALAAGMRRSAAVRECPECRRGAALVDRSTAEYYRTACRWAEVGKCSWPGTYLERRW